MISLKDEEDKYQEERIRNIRKQILIENLDEINLNKKKKKEFIKYYYFHLDDMNLLEALDEFKKL